jgi:hypothetical protein
MKKSLVLASLLLVGTSSIASNYIEIGYGVRKTESYGIVADDPNYTGDTDGYWVSWNRNTKNYILAVRFNKNNAKISKRIVLGEELDYDGELTYGSINGALKVKLLEKIFFAPWLSYSSGKYKYRVTQPEEKRYSL